MHAPAGNSGGVAHGFQGGFQLLAGFNAGGDQTCGNGCRLPQSKGGALHRGKSIIHDPGNGLSVVTQTEELLLGGFDSGEAAHTLGHGGADKPTCRHTSGERPGFQRLAHTSSELASPRAAAALGFAFHTPQCFSDGGADFTHLGNDRDVAGAELCAHEKSLLQI